MSRSLVLNEKRINQMVEFKEEHEFYLGLGKSSAWEDENNPPDLTGDEEEVEELFGFVKSKIEVEESVFQNTAYVKESAEGEIFYRERNYTIVADEDVEGNIEQAFHLLFCVTLPLKDSVDDKFDNIDDYRQAGLYLDLVPESGYEEEEVLLYPDEVDDVGELYALSNFRKIVRVTDRVDRVYIILSF